eukprot:1161018-Pelagomonas_calceolata.AAC.3
MSLRAHCSTHGKEVTDEACPLHETYKLCGCAHLEADHSTPLVCQLQAPSTEVSTLTAHLQEQRAHVQTHDWRVGLLHVCTPNNRHYNAPERVQSRQYQGHAACWVGAATDTGRLGARL